MALTNAALSPVLRLLCAQEIPSSVRHVVMTVPQTEAGKLLFNLVRHVLGLASYDAAAAIDLQRLQKSSQLIGVVLERFTFSSISCFWRPRLFVALRRLRCGQLTVACWSATGRL
jgi:hypothetical protein